MTLTARRADFDSLGAAWTELLAEARSPAGPFVTPQFYGAWWAAFGHELPLDLMALEDGDELRGVLPLTHRGDVVSFAADHEVADYMDLVAAPGREDDVGGALLDHLDQLGCAEADLRGLTACSWTVEGLAALAQRRGWSVASEQEAVCPVIMLPSTWTEYVEGLPSRDRREVRRKLRTLRRTADAVSFEVIEERGAVADCLPTFFRLMTESRGDKAAFLTERMAAFFHALVCGLADAGYARLYLLKLGDEPAASVLTFVHDDTLLLYNSGYDPKYQEMSVGLASKVFCIRDAIERGMTRVNFLRGDEEYKFQLGAEATPVTRLRLRRESQSAESAS